MVLLSDRCLAYKEDLESQLDQSGLKYIHDDSVKAQKFAEAETRLDELIKATRNAYRSYRAGIQKAHTYRIILTRPQKKADYSS